MFSNRPIRSGIVVGGLVFSGLLAAQDPQQSPPQAPPPSASDNGGWKRIGDSNSPGSAPAPLPPQNQPPPAASVPSQLTIKPGTYVTIRINQPLSSDKNQVGDAFSATLVRPIVVDGVVVAERGQTLGGRVSEVQKAGRVSGVSKLGLQLTDIPVADGQQVPVQTQLISRQGPTSVGRDATAIGATTVVGAAVGAGVGGAGGAAVGAGAGLLVSTVGVLLTRGRPTIVYPETVLTYRIEQPVTISTEHAPQAFRFVEPGDYQSAPPRMQSRAPGYGPGPGYGTPYAPYGPYPYYGPAYYPYPYWGPSFYGGVFFGPRFGRRW
jgi:hypothetical protein